MKHTLANSFLVVIIALIMVSCSHEGHAHKEHLAHTKPLALWSDSPSRTAIIDFVEAVTDSTLPTYVEPSDRIAVFDNDGTLWCEQPMYVQAVFAQQTSPVETDDLKKMIGASHGSMDVESFRTSVASWLDSTKHPRFNRRYNELTYAPMVELLSYLRANDFTTVISSGGGAEFMRVFAEEAYGVTPEHVIGSTIAITYDSVNGRGRLYREPKIGSINNEEIKPVGIWHRLGRRPIMAFGNSDGDQQMLEWVSEGDGARLCGLIHHTDAAREYTYDAPSKIGELKNAAIEAEKRGWLMVDMKSDWNTVFKSSDSTINVNIRVKR